MHLEAALENSTLRRILNFFSSRLQVSPVAMSSPRTFERNRTFCGWRTCRNMWRQVHRCRFRCFHNYFFFLLSLHPPRHRFGAAYLAVILNAANKAMLKKWRGLFHSSRVKLPLVKMSASWCLVSMYRIWFSESRLILSKQPIQSNSVGSRHMSHCGTSAFDDHFLFRLPCPRRHTT